MPLSPASVLQYNVNEQNFGSSVQRPAKMDSRSGSEQAAEAESPLYQSVDFRMYCMKVLPCSKRYCHDWTTCPFSHPGEKARRRDPTTQPHTGIACPDMKKDGACIRGDACPYAHNVFEYWLHPTRYRTQLCNDGLHCRRRICFFAHSVDELRVPACKPFVSPDALAAATTAAAAKAAREGRLPAMQPGRRSQDQGGFGNNQSEVLSRGAVQAMAKQMLLREQGDRAGAEGPQSGVDINVLLSQLQLQQQSGGLTPRRQQDAQTIQLLAKLLRDAYSQQQQGSPQVQQQQQQSQQGLHPRPGSLVDSHDSMSSGARSLSMPRSFDQGAFRSASEPAHLDSDAVRGLLRAQHPEMAATAGHGYSQAGAHLPPTSTHDGASGVALAQQSLLYAPTQWHPSQPAQQRQEGGMQRTHSDTASMPATEALLQTDGGGMYAMSQGRDASPGSQGSGDASVMPQTSQQADTEFLYRMLAQQQQQRQQQQEQYTGAAASQAAAAALRQAVFDRQQHHQQHHSQQQQDPVFYFDAQSCAPPSRMSTDSCASAATRGTSFDHRMSWDAQAPASAAYARPSLEQHGGSSYCAAPGRMSLDASADRGATFRGRSMMDATALPFEPRPGAFGQQGVYGQHHHEQGLGQASFEQANLASVNEYIPFGSAPQHGGNMDVPLSMPAYSGGWGLAPGSAAHATGSPAQSPSSGFGTSPGSAYAAGAFGVSLFARDGSSQRTSADDNHSVGASAGARVSGDSLCTSGDAKPTETGNARADNSHMPAAPQQQTTAPGK